MTSPGDWFGNSEDMIERIRPKARYDIAIAVSVVSLSVAIVWAAWLLRSNGGPRYQFMQDSNGIFVGSLYSGDVALCRWDGKGVVCTEDDSAWSAMLRAAE